MRTVFQIFGFIIMTAGVLAGVWVCVWWGWVGGIIQIIEAAKLTPVESWDIAVGIVRVVFANLVGALVGWAVFSLGVLVASIGEVFTSQRRYR